MNRGLRVAELVPASTEGAWRRAHGMFQGKINLYSGWDSREEDKRIEAAFEALTGTVGE